MAISYGPLFKTLHDRNLKRTDLLKGLKLSASTVAKLGKNEYVSLQVIDKICSYLDCKIEEVVEHKKEVQKF